MDRAVHYHHPVAENYSLAYSSTSVSDVRHRADTMDSPTKLVGYPFSTPVYVLYRGGPDIVLPRDVDYDREWLREQLSEQRRAVQVIAFRLVELLEAAVDVRGDEEFRLYKAFEPGRLEQIIDRVSWGAPLPIVAGTLMSNLILRHSLPNANHRTSIAMLQLCIESVASVFEMPRTHLDDHAWKPWADEYIVDSKRLITVRRNNLRFKHLARSGVEQVMRKDGICIELSSYDLDMHPTDAKVYYAERHEEHCIQFAKKVLRRAGMEDLNSTVGPELEEFVEFLENGLQERDFTDIF